MRRTKKIFELLLALMVFCVTMPADWYVNPFTGKLDYFEAGAAVNHAMSTHSDDDTYNINTTGSATVTEGYILGAEDTASPGGAFTIDWTSKQNHRVTITGVNLDITFTNPSGPCRLILVVIQGDGDDTVDWTNEADLKWPGGVAPTLSVGAADVDIVSFYFDGTNYYGVANYDFQ